MKIYNFYTLSSSENPEEIRYIGTTTKTVQQRFYHHKYNALHSNRRSTPVSKWIYSVYQSGYDIIINKIYECSESEWEDTEVRLISEYKQKYNLLNIQKGGVGVYTKEMRNDSGIFRSILAHQTKIVILNNDFKLIKVFDSCKECAQYLNVVHTAIGNVLSGRSRQCKGYYILKYNDYIKIKDIKSYILNNHFSYIKNAIYCFDLKGNLIKKYTCSEANNEGYNFKTLLKHSKNKTAYNNYYWSLSSIINIQEYKDGYKYKVGEKYYNSQTQIAKEYNMTPRQISRYFTKQIPINNQYIVKV